MSKSEIYPAAEAVTRGPKHHFFGYYDKCPWNERETKMLALEVDFMDRIPKADDIATVGIIDLEDDNHFKPIAKTRAWNFQQGAMLHWLPSDANRKIVYNLREDNRFVGVIHDIESDKRQILSKPIAGISRNGKWGLSLNFSRLYDMRRGYGYTGIEDPWKQEERPEDDGIYLIDMDTGESKLIISTAQVASFENNSNIKQKKHWINHFQFSTDDSRFCFLHRIELEGGGMFTRLFTANIDGSDLYCLDDSGEISHFDWRNSTELLAWARKKKSVGPGMQQKIVGLSGNPFFKIPLFKWILTFARKHLIGWIRQNIVGDRFVLYTDKSKKIEEIGLNILKEDGHCSYPPDKNWVLMDTYPHEDNNREILLYNHVENKAITVGRFFSLPEINGDIRCDLHVRWNRKGTQISFDSIHENSRQIYTLNVEDFYKIQ